MKFYLKIFLKVFFIILSKFIKIRKLFFIILDSFISHSQNNNQMKYMDKTLGKKNKRYKFEKKNIGLV